MREKEYESGERNVINIETPARRKLLSTSRVRKRQNTERGSGTIYTLNLDMYSAGIVHADMIMVSSPSKALYAISLPSVLDKFQSRSAGKNKMKKKHIYEQN